MSYDQLYKLYHTYLYHFLHVSHHDGWSLGEKLPRRRLPQVLASFGGADMEASFRQAPTRSVIGIGEWIGWIGWIKIQEIFSVKQEIFRFFFLGENGKKNNSTCCVVGADLWFARYLTDLERLIFTWMSCCDALQVLPNSGTLRSQVVGVTAVLAGGEENCNGHLIT